MTCAAASGTQAALGTVIPAVTGFIKSRDANMCLGWTLGRKQSCDTLLCVGLDFLICEDVFKLILVREFFQM